MGKGKPVIIRETGQRFESSQDCANYFQTSAGWIRSIARGDKGNRTCRGYHIDRLDGYSRPREPETRGGARPVKIVQTGEVYDSLSSCARALGCHRKYIYDSIATGEPYKGYNFIFMQK